MNGYDMVFIIVLAVLCALSDGIFRGTVTTVLLVILFEMVHPTRKSSRNAPHLAQEK